MTTEPGLSTLLAATGDYEKVEGHEQRGRRRSVCYAEE